MPKTKISEFSATPGNNTDIDGINIAEGCAPSGINDAIRELMAQLKDFQAGTAGDSFNGPVGTSTAAAGAFTTLSSTGNTTLGDASGDAVTINGATTFVNVSPTITPGTANGVAYLNGSKVLTTGSALTFNGTTLTAPQFYQTQNLAGAYNSQVLENSSSTGYTQFLFNVGSGGANGQAVIGYAPGLFFSLGPTSNDTTTPIVFRVNNGSEQARLTSTGLGIGTSSPDASVRLTVAKNDGIIQIQRATGTTYPFSFGIASDGRFNIYNATTASESLAITQAGNLGLGVTPSAWDSSYKAIRVNNFTLASQDQTGGGELSKNSYVASGGTNTYIANGFATKYEQAAGTHKWYTAPSGTAGNSISFTQAMTLTAAGDLGVGTTSPASRLSVTTSGTTLAQFTGAQYAQIRHSDGTRTLYTQVYDNVAFLSTESATPLAFGTGGTERARIDSSGNLLVGTTSASFASGGGINVKNATGAVLRLIGGSNTGFDLQQDSGANTYIWNRDSGYMAFATNNTERARITSGGQFLFSGLTTSVGNYWIQAKNTNSSSNCAYLENASGNDRGILVLKHDQAAGATTGAMVVFQNSAGTTVGTITSSNTATAYNTSSDYRIKDNPQPLTGSGAFIDALQPKTWNWKTDGSKGVGFIAHEVQAISPGSVVGVKDAVDEEGKPVMQAMEYGSAEFIANIIAELQSLRARVAALESNP